MNEILKKALLRAESAEPLSSDVLNAAMQAARLGEGTDDAALADEVARILAFASVLEDFDGVADAPFVTQAAEDKHALRETLAREAALSRASEQDGEHVLVPSVLS